MKDRTFLRSSVVAALVLGVAACGGCNPNVEQESAQCEFNTDCGQDEECQGSRCVPASGHVCATDDECGTGKVCQQGVCRDGTVIKKDGGVSRPDSGGSSSGASGQGILGLTPSDVVDFGSPLPSTDIV